MTSESTAPKWEDCVPFVPPFTEGWVVKVYDGDTFTIAAKLPYDASPLYRVSIRMNGIDTPEIKGSSPEEKRAAQAAKQALSDLILGKKVQLRNTSSEKYGRLLADVFVEERFVNQYMLDNKFAVPYDGGTKKAFEEHN